MERSADGGSDGHSPSIVPAAIGAVVGGIVVAAGAFGIFAFRRRRGSRSHNERWENPLRDSMLSSNSPQRTREMSANNGDGREYIVEPFNMPSTLALLSSGNPGVPLRPEVTKPTTSPANALSVSDSSDPTDQSGRRPNVYVVHHDGGRAPVTVYTEGVAEVVELPPQYAAGSSSAPSESGAPREVDRREPGTTPRKTREPHSK